MNMYLDGQQAHLTPDHMGFMVHDRLREKQTRVREAVKNFKIPVRLKLYRVIKINALGKWRELDLQVPCWLQLTPLG